MRFGANFNLLTAVWKCFLSEGSCWFMEMKRNDRSTASASVAWMHMTHENKKTPNTRIRFHFSYKCPHLWFYRATDNVEPDIRPGVLEALNTYFLNLLFTLRDLVRVDNTTLSFLCFCVFARAILSCLMGLWGSIRKCWYQILLSWNQDLAVIWI